MTWAYPRFIIWGTSRGVEVAEKSSVEGVSGVRGGAIANWRFCAFRPKCTQMVSSVVAKITRDGSACIEGC